MKKHNVSHNGKKSDNTIEKLDVLLSNMQIYFMNLRGLHWNIKGGRFFELHQKFEELYKDTSEKIDELAERILALDGQPTHSYSDYIKNATIKSLKNISNPTSALESLIEDLQFLISLEKGLFVCSNDCHDWGTNTLVAGYIVQYEKTLWMLKSCLQKQVKNQTEDLVEYKN
jgi:starvation-inducible DNA-binding protein